MLTHLFRCSSNLLSPSPKSPEDEKSQSSLYDVSSVLVKFTFNYFFAVYFLSLAETEETWVNSIMYSFSAIYFFAKVPTKSLLSISNASPDQVLLYSALTKDALNRFFIAITIFLTGTRISLLSYNLRTPFYFGTLLTQLSIFATYISFNPKVSLPLCLAMFGGSLIHATISNSVFMMILGLLNLCGFLGMMIGSDRQMCFKIFLGLTAAVTVVVIASGFTLEAFYNTVNKVVNDILPAEITKFLNILYNRELLPEQLFAKTILGFFYKVFAI